MNHVPTRSEHIAYSTDEGEPRLYEYEKRWKIKALEMVQSLSVHGKKPTVLDFGCGRGEFLQMLREAGVECAAVDFDPRCVELGSQYAPCHQASIDNVTEVLRGQKFDVVTCLHVLEHLEYPKVAVQRLSELSNRWLLFAVPNLCTPDRLVWRRVHPCNEGHYQGWDASHFQNFLEKKCGLRILRWVPDTVVAFHPKLSKVLNVIGLRRHFEYQFLPRHFPFLSISLLVLCEKTGK